MTIPISAWWLWPELLRQEALFVMLVISFNHSCAGALRAPEVPVAHELPHLGGEARRRGRRVSALVMFAGGPTWPFRLATPLCVLAALEQIAITLVLPESPSDVRSLWHVLRQLGSAR